MDSAETQNQATTSARASLEEKVFLTWRSPERSFKPRGKEFYSTIIVLAFLVSVILFFIEGVVPVLVVLAIVFVVWATSKTPPGEAEHQLTSWGIRTGGKLYRYSEMVVFWIEEKWGNPVLRVLLSTFPGQMILLLNKENEDEIKKMLADNQVTMQKPSPSWTDRMVKWFGEKIPLD